MNVTYNRRRNQTLKGMGWENKIKVELIWNDSTVDLFLYFNQTKHQHPKFQSFFNEYKRN